MALSHTLRGLLKTMLRIVLGVHQRDFPISIESSPKAIINRQASIADLTIYRALWRLFNTSGLCRSQSLITPGASEAVHQRQTHEETIFANV